MNLALEVALPRLSKVGAVSPTPANVVRMAISPRAPFASTVYLTPKQIAELRHRSAVSGVPLAVLVRRGVDRELAEPPPVSLLQCLTPEFVAELTPLQIRIMCARICAERGA